MRLWRTHGGDSTYLLIGLGGLAAVLDPGVFVIGGGVSAAGELLRAPALAAFRACLTGHGHRPVAELRMSASGYVVRVGSGEDAAELPVSRRHTRELKDRLVRAAKQGWTSR